MRVPSTRVHTPNFGKCVIIEVVETEPIRHQPRRLSYALFRRLEIERDIAESPDGRPDVSARCPDCDAVMVYRGIGRLRNGTHVHTFECVHSHREVHSLSIVITD